jgi:RND family efflux transporter MFP subunit
MFWTYGGTLKQHLVPLRWLMVSVALWLVAGCGESENKFIPPPPSEVTVSQPVKKAVTEYVDLTGNTQAIQQVSLVGRVEGFLTSINFKDGDIVKKGDLLFVIEPPPYEAKVRLEEANVAKAQATLLRSTLEYNRQLQLIKQNATAQSTVEQWQAQRDADEASLQQNKANLDIARINLSYTQVRAPFIGRIDRHLVDVGNLVGAANTATQLANIYQLDPIYAYFSLNERDLVRIMERDRERRQDKPSLKDKDEDTPVYLAIEGEEGYPHEGRLDFTATSLDSSTGTLLMRGVFNNPFPVSGAAPSLLPGMFVRVRIPVHVRKRALLVSERALGVDQGGRYLLVVNEQNVVEQRSVTVGQLEDGMRVIKQGLKEDEWVVVNGIQRTRPGAMVKPVRQEQPTVQSPTEAGAGAPGTQEPAARPQDNKGKTEGGKQQGMGGKKK